MKASEFSIKCTQWKEQPGIFCSKLAHIRNGLEEYFSTFLPQKFKNIYKKNAKISTKFGISFNGSKIYYLRRRFDRFFCSRCLLPEEERGKSRGPIARGHRPHRELGRDFLDHACIQPPLYLGLIYFKNLPKNENVRKMLQQQLW